MLHVNKFDMQAIIGLHFYFVSNEIELKNNNRTAMPILHSFWSSDEYCLLPTPIETSEVKLVNSKRVYCKTCIL